MVMGMTEGVFAAILSGIVTLTGVLIANSKAQAVTDTKIEELTREVREHNNFARRVPLLEAQVETLRGDIRELQTLHERT
jgi:hypothetical protein